MIKNLDSSQSHSLIGKYGYIVDNPAMKWFLRVLIARSVVFRLCMCGGTSWKSMSYFFITSFKSLEHSFSIIYYFGSLPLALRTLWILRKVSCLVAACLFLIGSARVALLS